MAALLILAGKPAAAQERQYKLEAAFLYNFFNYITWPGFAEPGALKEPIVCIEQADPVAPYLEYVRQRMRAERHIAIRTLSENEALEGCHVFFTHRGMPAAQAKEAIRTRTLTVSTAQGHLRKGGMIELTPEGSRIGMKINHSLLNTEGFEVSSRLLGLAKRVE